MESPHIAACVDRSDVRYTEAGGSVFESFEAMEKKACGMVLCSGFFEGRWFGDKGLTFRPNVPLTRKDRCTLLKTVVPMMLENQWGLRKKKWKTTLPKHNSLDPIAALMDSAVLRPFHGILPCSVAPECL